MIVRPEEPADRAESLLVEREAFDGPAEPGIVEAVRNEPGSFALVAEDDGAIVGHVQLSTAWVGEEPVLALGPIAVRRDRRRLGVGSALVREALREAASRGSAAVILLGDPRDYGRLGFEPASRHGLANPFAGVTDGGFTIEEGHFQIAVLDADRVARFGGDVRWHPAFG